MNTKDFHYSYGSKKIVTNSKLSWFDIDDSLTQRQKHLFIEHGRHSFFDHTTGEDDTHLDIAVINDAAFVNEIHDKYQIAPSLISLMRIKSGDEVVPHVDNPVHKRATSVVFPLSPSGKNYAPCTMYEPEKVDIGWRSCYAFDTTKLHGVKNDTDHDRYQAQIWFNLPLEDVFSLYQDKKFLSC